jgi:hypothetical protein
MLLTDVTCARVKEKGASRRTAITSVWASSDRMQKLSLATGVITTFQATSSDSLVLLYENFAVQIILVTFL